MERGSSCDPILTHDPVGRGLGMDPGAIVDRQDLFRSFPQLDVQLKNLSVTGINEVESASTVNSLIFSNSLIPVTERFFN